MLTIELALELHNIFTEAQNSIEKHFVLTKIEFIPKLSRLALLSRSPHKNNQIESRIFTIKFLLIYFLSFCTS